MAKAKKVAVRRVSRNDAELNRWCIEQAMRWPVISTGGYGQAGAYSSMPRMDSDADIVGRAKKIRDWVNGQ